LGRVSVSYDDIAKRQFVECNRAWIGTKERINRRCKRLNNDIADRTFALADVQTQLPNNDGGRVHALLVFDFENDVQRRTTIRYQVILG
jgi:hypothetical protein